MFRQCLGLFILQKFLETVDLNQSCFLHVFLKRGLEGNYCSQPASQPVVKGKSRHRSSSGPDKPLSTVNSNCLLCKIYTHRNKTKEKSRNWSLGERERERQREKERERRKCMSVSM